MKKLKGFSTGAIVTIVIILAILVLGTILIIKHNQEAVDYTQYTAVSVIEPSKDNGQIGDHVRGDANAPVVIHEYANFQCNHCADLNPYIEQAVADFDGQLAVVFRNLTWAAFQNSRAAAAAAEAAGLQGYWEPYADLLFENQAEWYSASGSDRTALFEKYFTEVTNGAGNLDQFRSDLASDAVSKKIDFDSSLAKNAGAEGTPAFFVDNQFINLEGGELYINDQTITYEGISTPEDLTALFQKIINAKTGA